MKDPAGIALRQPMDFGANGGVYAPPTFEVISLDCEITSYAPDEDLPLF